VPNPADLLDLKSAKMANQASGVLEQGKGCGPVLEPGPHIQ